MRRCDWCGRSASCTIDMAEKCLLSDALYFKPIPREDRQFVGRCDNCGAVLYSDDIMCKAELGRTTFTLCKCCFEVVR